MKSAYKKQNLLVLVMKELALILRKLSMVMEKLILLGKKLAMLGEELSVDIRDREELLKGIVDESKLILDVWVEGL